MSRDKDFGIFEPRVEGTKVVIEVDTAWILRKGDPRLTIDDTTELIDLLIKYRDEAKAQADRLLPKVVGLAGEQLEWTKEALQNLIYSGLIDTDRVEEPVVIDWPSREAAKRDAAQPAPEQFPDRCEVGLCRRVCDGCICACHTP